MSRLYDRLITYGVAPPPLLAGDPGASATIQAFGDLLSSATIVVADNVAEYYFAGTDQEMWHLRDDFPCLVPPAPALWVETRKPSKIVSSKYGVQQPTHPPAWGVMFQTLQASSQRGVFSDAYRNHTPWADLHPDAKWLVLAGLVVEQDKGKAIGPIAWWMLELDDQGMAIVEGEDVRLFELVALRDRETARSLSGAFLKPLLLAISFMHCKNVTVRDEYPPMKMSRAYERRHGHPLTKFRVIDIHPFREAALREGGGRAGNSKALHQVRGHFKTYTSENKLFGRHVGRWFWAQHVAGDLERGTVDQEYRVAPK